MDQIVILRLRAVRADFHTHFMTGHDDSALASRQDVALGLEPADAQSTRLIISTAP